MDTGFVRANQCHFASCSSFLCSGTANDVASNCVGPACFECLRFWLCWMPSQSQSMKAILSARSAQLDVKLREDFMEQFLVRHCGPKQVLIVDALHNVLLLLWAECHLRWTCVGASSAFCRVSTGNDQFVFFVQCLPDVFDMVCCHAVDWTDATAWSSALRLRWLICSSSSAFIRNCFMK